MMQMLLAVATAAGFLSSVGLVEATKHHLFVSSYRTQHLFALSFDDQTFQLAQEKELVAHAGHPFMQFNHDRTILYASERRGFTSYRVGATLNDLYFASHISLSSVCSNEGSNRGQTSFVAAQHSPFKVYGAGRGICGATIGVRSDGAMDKIEQNVTFRTDSRIKGMAIDPLGKFMFSADRNENGIWVHKILDNGLLDKGRVAEMPIEDSKVMRIVVHPEGRYLYALWRKANKIAVFEIVPKSDPSRPPRIRYTNITIPLIPSGK